MAINKYRASTGLMCRWRDRLYHPGRLFSLAAGALIVMVTAAGCQQVHKTAMTLPPPVSAARQIAALNSRARQLATLRMVGTLKLNYAGRLGNRHEFQAHFVLLADQRPVLSGKGKAELLLSGTYLGQNVFEMGINRRMYWLINRRQRIAYVARAGVHAGAARPIPIDPHKILQMLAIGELQHTPRQSVVMTAFSHDPYNRVFVVHTAANGQAYVQRELVVDRLTGHVREVELFDRRGLAEARAMLTAYKAVGGSGSTVMCPADIDIRYPAGRAQLHLVVSTMQLKLKVPAKYAFASPAFSGLRIVAVRSAPGGISR